MSFGTSRQAFKLAGDFVAFQFLLPFDKMILKSETFRHLVDGLVAIASKNTLSTFFGIMF